MYFTMVDRFNKYVMLIPCKHTVTIEEVACLFIRFWYPLAGLPMLSLLPSFGRHCLQTLAPVYSSQVHSIGRPMGKQRYIISWLLMF